MKRRDIAVLSISVGLGLVVAGGVAYSQFVLDRSPVHSASGPADSVASLLVMTWGPSLCKVDPANPGCKSGHVEQMGQALVLHGLWPQPQSEQLCGVQRSVADRVKNTHDGNMPSVDLPPDVQAKLQGMMSDGSMMAPHEWYTHGTCSGLPPAEYFNIATNFADQVGKVFNPVFGEAQGKRLSAGEVRGKADDEFGEGAGDRIGLTCRNVDGEGLVTYEMQISLPPVLDMRDASKASLKDWILKGPLISAGCGQGNIP